MFMNGITKKPGMSSTSEKDMEIGTNKNQRQKETGFSCVISINIGVQAESSLII